MVIRHLVIFIIFIWTTGFNARPECQIKSFINANEVLRKLSVQLDNSKTISYNYKRSINYFSENYHNEISVSTFFDFNSADTVLGFKYQLENEQYKMVFNGTESFYLNQKDKAIKINNKPKLADFSSLSFFVNSIVTLKKALPFLIAEKEVIKTLADTTIAGKSFHLVSIVLKNKTIDGLGTFTPITQKRDFIYKVIIDKETFLPLYIIQSNNVEPKDYVLTSFSNIIINGNNPPELSWYYSTYTNNYKAASERTVSLIKKDAIAPDWKLPYFSAKDSLSLSDLKGKVVLLEFWIKNCGYCIGAIPKLNTLTEKYAGKKFQVIGINAHDTKEDISSFYQRNNPNFKTAYDIGKVISDYGVDTFPTIVLVSKNGKVLYSGAYDHKLLDNLIEDALK